MNSSGHASEVWYLQLGALGYARYKFTLTTVRICIDLSYIVFFQIRTKISAGCDMLINITI